MKPSIYYFLAFFIFNSVMHAGWAEEILNSLSCRQKIGQLFMVATMVNTQQQEEQFVDSIIDSPYKFDHDIIEKLIKDYHVGGIIYLYKGMPQQQIALTNHLQSLSLLPLLIGQDFEYGLSMRLYNTIRFPRHMTLGALQNRELIYELGKEIGMQCKVIGVHINFAPVVDINSNPENPVIHMRSFGDNKEQVTKCSIAFMRGLQDAGILACAKHFPGHGDTFQDSHNELPVILKTKDELYETELYSFKNVIDSGVDCIMNAHLQTVFDKTSHLPSSLSYKVVTSLLRDELGFRGLSITDGMGMKAVIKYHKPGYAELKAFLAGNDIILCPVDVPKAIELIEQSILDGKITHKELDARVLKILKVKEQMQLHENRLIDDKNIDEKLKSDKAYDLKKQLYQQAITLVNCNTVLPLKKEDFETTSVIQIGGYLPSEFEKALEQAYMEMYNLPSEPQKESIQFVLSKLSDKKTIIIALFDLSSKAHENYALSKSSLNLINQLKIMNKKIIFAVFGTPYTLNLFDKNESFVVAYEDDPDAQKAAAEIILGNMKSTGTLPITLNN